MPFKKKSDTLAAAVASVAANNPNPVKVDLTPDLPPDLTQLELPQTQLPQVEVKIPMPTIQPPKQLHPCSIPLNVAEEVLAYISNPTRGLENVVANPHGGINLFVRDTSTGTLVPIVFNKQGLVDLVRFGLEAIVNNR
jgi:hypothetical protein